MIELQLLPHEAKFIQDLHMGTVIVHNRNNKHYYTDGNELDLLKIILWIVNIDGEVKDLIDGTT